MSDNSFSSEYESYPSDTHGSYKQAPKMIDAIGLLFVLLGAFLGVYGILNRNQTTASQQSLIGAVGYFLTVIVPIALLQLIRMRHANASRVDKDNNEIEVLPYFVHDKWARLQSRLLKIVALGLVCAFFSITVFFWPIAQGFA